MKNDFDFFFKKSKQTLIISILIFLPAFSIFAQINAFVGYAYTQNSDNKTFNTIIQHYNTHNPNLLQPMSTLNFLHGVDLGIRYRFPAVSLEFNWFNKLNQINDRVLGSDNIEYKNNIYYKSQTFCLGLEFYHQWFGLGTSIDWNHLVIKKEKSTDRVKMDWLSQSGFTNHIFLNFEFNMNDVMALSIRPFVQLPLYKNDLYIVEQKLNPNTAGNYDPSVYKQKIINWGVKFLFMNGEKSR